MLKNTWYRIHGQLKDFKIHGTGFMVNSRTLKHMYRIYGQLKYFKIHGTGFMINSNALKYMVRTRGVVYYCKYACFQTAQREYGLRKFPRA